MRELSGTGLWLGVEPETRDGEAGPLALTQQPVNPEEKHSRGY